MSSTLFLNMLTVSLPIALLILLLLILLRQFGKRVTAKCRYIVWAAVILRLCIPFGAFMLPPMYEVDIPAEVEFTVPQADIQTNIPVATVTDAVQTAPPVNHSVPVIDSAVVSVTDKIIEPPDNITAAEQPKLLMADTAVIIRILSYIWLTGAVMFIVWKLTVYNINAASLVRSSKPAGETNTKLYKKLCDRYKIKHTPLLLINNKVSSPMLCGYFKPYIILPDIELSQNALVGILAHELTHYRRRDLWMKLLCVLAASLHWWNPLVYIAAKRCNNEMELSCDEAVLAGLDEDARRSYGNVMLGIIKRCGKSSGTLTTQFNPKKNAVKERFYGIMDMNKKKRGLWIIAAVVLICIIAGTIIGCNVGVKTSPDYAVYWGYYLRCDNGSDMILIDGYSGDGSLAPCSMTAGNDGVSFVDLTDGDRIKIEVMLIGETYPMQTTVYNVEKLSDGERSDIDANMLAQLAELGWVSTNVYDEESLPEELSSLLSMTVAEIRSQYGELTLEYSEDGPGYPIYSLEKLPGVTIAFIWSMDEPLTDSMLPNEVIITDAYGKDISGVSAGDNIENAPKMWTADSYSVMNGTVTMYADSGNCRISLVLSPGESGWNMEMQEDNAAFDSYIKTWLSDFAKSPTGTITQIRIRKQTTVTGTTVYYLDDPDTFLPPEATRLIQRYDLPLSITFYVYETEPKSLCIYNYASYDHSLTKCEVDLPTYSYEAAEIIYMSGGGGSGEGYMEVRFEDKGDSRYESYSIYVVVGDTSPRWELMEESSQHKRSDHTELTSENGTVAHIYHDVPGNWFFDGGMYNDSNGKKRMHIVPILYQNYSADNFQAELAAYEEFPPTADALKNPIIGETNSGVKYTGYLTTGAQIQGEIWRRYIFRFELDDSFSYVADVWEHTYIDSTDYFDTVLLPLIKSFSFDLEPVNDEATLTITSIDDWEKLGLTREDYRYPFFKAFLERDTVTLEKLSNRPAGLYDSYKQLEFGDYQINRIKPTPQSEYAYTLAIEIIKGTDALPVGNYQFIYNEYPGNCLLRIFPVNNNSGEAYVVLKNLLNTTRDYALDGVNSDSFNWGLTEYIINALGKNKTTAQDISDYANRYFGIEDFVPSEDCRTDDGYYYVPAHGGGQIICEPVSSEYDEASGEYTVTVQFYADYGMTVYSHRVAYRMKYDGTDWAFLGYEVQSKGEFEPYKYAT